MPTDKSYNARKEFYERTIASAKKAASAGFTETSISLERIAKLANPDRNPGKSNQNKHRNNADQCSMNHYP